LFAPDTGQSGREVGDDRTDGSGESSGGEERLGRGEVGEERVGEGSDGREEVVGRGGGGGGGGGRGGGGKGGGRGGGGKGEGRGRKGLLGRRGINRHDAKTFRRTTVRLYGNIV